MLNQVQHSGGLFWRRRVDPCCGWFGWWYGCFLDEALGVCTERLIEGELAGRMHGVDLSVVHLIRGHQTDPAMVMLLVVPVEEGSAETSGILDTTEAFGKARLILQCLEVAFGKGVVVGGVRPVMRAGDAKVGQQERRCFRLHRPPAIGMQ